MTTLRLSGGETLDVAPTSLIVSRSPKQRLDLRDAAGQPRLSDIGNANASRVSVRLEGGEVVDVLVGPST